MISYTSFLFGMEQQLMSILTKEQEQILHEHVKALSLVQEKLKGYHVIGYSDEPDNQIKQRVTQNIKEINEYKLLFTSEKILNIQKEDYFAQYKNIFEKLFEMLKFSVARFLDKNDVFYIQMDAQENFFRSQLQQSTSYVISYC